MMDSRQLGRWEVVGGRITFGLAVLTGFSFLSMYVPPYYAVWFQWLGLSLPILLIINFLLLVFWAIRRKKWFYLSLVALLSNFHYYSKVYQFPFRDKSKSDSVPDLVVASYNVHGFQLDYGGSSLMNIAELVEEKHAQVVCLQEVPNDLDKATLLKAFRTMRYIISTEKVENSSNILVLSTFPIKRSQVISFPERANCAVTADLDVKGRLMRVITCHLQTTNWNQIKNKPNEERNFGFGFWHLFAIESVVGRNYQYRGLQADSLSELIRRSRVPVIVCGDFNDTPISYTYRKMRGQLADSFRESGKGYAYTYRYLHKLFRIDYLFYSPGDLKARYYESPEVVYSDHNPIIIGLDWVN